MGRSLRGPWHGACWCLLVFFAFFLIHASLYTPTSSANAVDAATQGDDDEAARMEAQVSEALEKATRGEDELEEGEIRDVEEEQGKKDEAKETGVPPSWSQPQPVAVWVANPWREREPIDPLSLIFGAEEKHHKKDKEGTWHVDTDVLWEARLSGPSRVTPLIVDLYRDGSKQILVSAGGRVESFDARTGRRLPTFNHGGSGPVFVAMHDISGDGREEVITVGEDGHIRVWHESGWGLNYPSFEVPHLPVPRHWFEGLEALSLLPSFSLYTRNDLLTANVQTIPSRLRSSNSQSGADQHKPAGAPSPPAPPMPDISDPRTQAATPAEPESGDAVWKGFEGWLPPDGIQSLDLFLPEDKEKYWAAEKVGGRPNKRFSTPEHDENVVFLDPHILAEPVIRDVDGDGLDDMLVVVSYYLQANRANEQDADRGKYAAGSVICFNLPNGTIKWNSPLELSFADRAYSPYIYQPPSVGDIEGDGNIEILVGTGLGMLHLLEGKTGKPRVTERFPINMDSIHGRVAMHDVDGNGFLDIIACDDNGNVAVFNHMGVDIWSAQFSSQSHSGPSVGDVDGDGQLDIVLTTEAGHVWAWNAKSGQPLSNFPMRLESRIYDRPLLLYRPTGGLSIVITGDNGVLYLIDPLEPAIERVDIGLFSCGMVLVDDLLGNDEAHLVVASTNGRVLTLTTGLPLVPLAAVRGNLAGRMGNTYGIYVEGPRFRQVNGRTFPVSFRIIDNSETLLGPYKLTFYVAGLKVLTTSYDSPGAYSVTLDVPQLVSHSVGVEVTGENKLSEEWHDSFTIQTNINFARTLKWMVVVPFMLSAAALFYRYGLPGSDNMRPIRR